MDTNIINATCYICGADGITHYQTVNECVVLRCNNCKLLWVPEPSASKISELYNGTYFNTDGKIGYKDYLADEGNIRENSRAILQTLSRRTDISGCRMLDVGCAYGFLLDEAKKKYGCEVFGIEISTQARLYAQETLGLDVRDCDLLSCDFPAESFDISFLIGTIEHLTAPRQTLQQIHRLLKPGGLFVITTIDTGGMLPFYMIKPPEHCFYFSHTNLAQLLSATGFTVSMRKTYFVKYFLHDLFHRLYEFSSLGLFRFFSEATKKIAPHFSIKIPTNEMIIISIKT